MGKSVLPFSKRLPFGVRTIISEGPSGGSADATDTSPQDDAAPSGEAEPEGDEETEPGDDAEDSDSEDADSAGEEALGDAGKQALDRMKTKWKNERDKRRALEEKYEPATDEAADILAKANQRVLRSEIKAAAAGKLHDPADAYRFLDLAQFEVGDDGEVDEAEIADAIDALVDSKPYLAAQTQRKRIVTGGGGNGVRKDSRPHQLTEQDVDRMTPEQVNKARREGRLRDLGY